jgi:hypothetical protein
MIEYQPQGNPEHFKVENCRPRHSEFSSDWQRVNEEPVPYLPIDLPSLPRRVDRNGVVNEEIFFGIIYVQPPTKP